MPRDLRNEREYVITVCQADACGQGRNRCPAPQACQLPETDELSWFYATLAISFLGVVGIAVMVLT